MRHFKYILRIKYLKLTELRWILPDMYCKSTHIKRSLDLCKSFFSNYKNN